MSKSIDSKKRIVIMEILSVPAKRIKTGCKQKTGKLPVFCFRKVAVAN